MAQQPSNSVFISYRREATGPLVRLIYRQLSENDIDVFYDIEAITVGQFGAIILSAIAARPYFMPVFTPGTLKRCLDPNDWMRREIEHALSLNRAFVPLYVPKFRFSDLNRYLPHIAETIRAFNMVKLPIHEMQYFDYALHELAKNYLKPITLNVSPPTPEFVLEITQMKKEVATEPGVTKLQFSAMTYFIRAVARNDNSDKEIADYTEAIRLIPDFPEAYHNRASARKMRGGLDGAIADYTEAIRLRSEYAVAYVNRGTAFFLKGVLENAIADYTEAIRLDSNDSEAYNNRGIAYGTKGDFDKSIVDFTEAVRLNPNFSDAYNNRGNSRLSIGDVDGAITDCTEAISLKPDNAEAYDTRGSARAVKNDFAGAIDDCSETIRLKPNFAEAYWDRGSAHEKNGDIVDATTDYKFCLNLQPNHPQAGKMRDYISKYGK